MYTVCRVVVLSCCRVVVLSCCRVLCIVCHVSCVMKCVWGFVDVAELCLWVAGTYCAVGVLCGAAVWAGAGGELRRRGKTGDDVYVL